MNRRIMFLLAVLAASFTAFLAAPAVASAGCLATATTPFQSGSSMQENGKMDCTTNNGSQYQLRVYIQCSLLGDPFAICHGPSVRTVNSPPNNSHYTLPLISGGCPWSVAITKVRGKVVVENMSTGTIDTSFSSSVTPCH